MSGMEDIVVPVSGQRLSKSERLERIVSELGASPALRASELASNMGVSHETIRRDLMELDSRGLINRTYGGAARPFAYEPPVRERHKRMINERERIAARTCDLISENEVVLMGAGATTNHVARRMVAYCRNITVITHDFTVAETLCHNPAIRTLFLAGRVHPTEGYVYGSQTVAGINSFQANWAIVGASGYGAFGVCDADDEAAAVYRAMTMRAARSIIVADATKFDQPSLVVFAQWNEVDFLVTDQVPEGPLGKQMSQLGVKLIVAE